MQTDSLIGQQFNAFQVEAKIGQGGMATVYRAHQASVNRSIALKVIALDSAQGRRDEFRERFAQEARVIASLEHIHILPIYDYGIVNDQFAYIAMRLLRGGTLADVLRDTVPLDRAADLLIQMARGLSYAHSKGVLHRDLKPSNILLDETGNAFLSDFGLAKLIENPIDITRSDSIVGTPSYMSPEQLRGEALDARSDIYSLGVILYHLVAGTLPFRANDNNVLSVIYQHLEKMPDPPSQFNPQLPAGVDAVVLKALAKQPTARYSTAIELAMAFNESIGRTVSTGSYPVITVRDPESKSTETFSKIIPDTNLTPDSRPSTPSGTTTPSAIIGNGRTSSLSLLFAAVMIAAFVLGALVVASGMMNPAPLPPAATIMPRATVLEGEVATMGTVIPTPAEIALARASLGANGFIAYAACNQSSQYHAAQVREIAVLAAAYNLPFRIYNADTDKYAQQTQIEQARADGVRGLIVCPLDPELLEVTLSSAADAGLPMVFMVSQMENYGGVLMAGDDYLMGVRSGQALGEILNAERDGQANIVILDFPDMQSIVVRADGLEAGVKEIAPNVNIVGRFLGATREFGEASIAKLIADGVEFDAILSINDAGSYGAIAALEAAGIPPDEVIISSVDAESLARQYIADDYYLRASLDVGSEAFSRAGVNTLVKLLAGATVVETILVPPGETITRTNLIEATAEAG